MASGLALGKDLGAGSAPGRLARVSVFAFGGFIALLVLVSAFFTERNGDIDELMMYNPSYMLAHFGKITFPSYTFRSFYGQPVIIHPPIHLGLIGLLERIGFTWYYAEAIPVVVFLLLGILVIVCAPFPTMVKLGFLFSIGFVVSTGEDFVVAFGVRPEGEVLATWLAGLVLLESGRLEGWNRARLFAGALLVTWASGVHYYACAAFTGIFVYIVWAVKDLGWRQARSRIAALVGGGCLFGIPYVALYLAPHLKQILTFVRLAKGDAGIGNAIRTHLSDYALWAHATYIPALIRKPMSLGIPLAVFSTIALGAIRYTRGISLAALPLQVFVFFFAAHKLPNYLINEIALFVAAMAVAGFAICDWLWRGIPLPKIHGTFPVITALLAAGYLVIENPALNAAQFSASQFSHVARVHEGDLARAATRQILGPHARVTGRDGGWYTSGADYWFEMERDMLREPHYEPASYFANFDAAVDYAHYSENGANGTISSWYADGTLKLRGFYFGETNEQLQLVLLSQKPVKQVVGYASRKGQVYRFEEQPSGNFQLLSAACPITPQLERTNWINRWPETFSAVEYLPQPAPGAAVIATVLFPRELPEPAGWMHRSCREMTSISGSLTPVDKNALIQQMRSEDTPVQFPRMLEELPGYRGVVLPESMRPPNQSARLDGIVKLSEIRATTTRARVEHLPQIRVTTFPVVGAFAAAIPLTHGKIVTGPCWLQLRLRVLTGEIGFAAYGRKGIIARTKLSLVKSHDPIDVALPIPNLQDVTSIIIFNDSALAGAQVDVLDASVAVPSDVGERNESTLSALR